MWIATTEMEAMNKNHNALMKMLLRVGIVRLTTTGKYRWPIHFAPKHIWTSWRYLKAQVKTNKLFYVFRNLPGVIKTVPGSMLPRRWGFGIMGLVEFGQRG